MTVLAVKNRLQNAVNIGFYRFAKYTGTEGTNKAAEPHQQNRIE